MNLESIEQTLIQKFSALEELMAGLNAQSQFLSAQFGQ
jgi:flagellar capping protein FliD